MSGTSSMARKGVNMQAIATEAGYSMATVSLALRGAKRIPVKTRKKICAIAARRGYRVAPLLSKAFAFARRPEYLRYRETLAMILEYPLAEEPSYQKGIYDHASAYAETLGYRIDPFQVSGKAKDHHRLSRVLSARGIRGVIVLPRLENKFPRLHLDWQKFAAVEIGRTLWHPRGLHRVERSIYLELIEVFHLLKKAGYQRIGMAVEPTADKMRQGLYTAACLIAQYRLPQKQVIPPMTRFGDWGEKTFRSWFKKYRPDVIIVHSTDAVPGWIRAMGLSIPHDVSIFGSNATESNLSGLTSNLHLYGVRAVELLSVLLDRNVLGLPEEPYCWQVKGQWKSGESLKKSLNFPSTVNSHPIDPG